MRKIIFTLLLALFPVSALASCLTLNGAPMTVNGAPFCLDGSTSPLSLPLVSSGAPIFTFLGSFKVPFAPDGGGMSVSGNTLYVAGLDYNPYNSEAYVDGLGAVTIPTLSGTPAYNGSNGGTATVVTQPSVAISFVAKANYSLSSAPVTGATTVTFTSLPTGIAANDGWFVTLSDNEFFEVTALSGNTATLNGSITGTGLSTTVSVYQWQPLYPFGNAQGYTISGSLAANGNVYVTGGTNYDATCDQQTGWISQVTPDLATWGVANTVAGQTTEYSRRYMGSINSVPSIWQSLLGASAYVANGPHQSIVTCEIPAGFSFTLFDPSSVLTSANAVSLKPALDYFWQGGGVGQPEQLNYRRFSGPFPTTTTSGYQFTLATAPVAGATSFTLAKPFPNDNTNSVGFFDATSTDTTGTTTTQLVASAPTGGWPVSWAANYWAHQSGTLSDLTHGGDCQISASTAVTAGSTGTMTITCVGDPNPVTTAGDEYSLTLFGADGAGSGGAPFLVTFSDGEQRVVEMQFTQTAQPISSSAVFTTLDGCTSGTCTTAPLTCNPSCSTAVTIQPLSDLYFSDYTGPFGTAFISPGSSSLVTVTVQEYGPGLPRPSSTDCYQAQSSTNANPVTPDTGYYIAPFISVYKMQDIINQENGVNPIYTATPYATWKFPDFSNWETGSNGCFQEPDYGQGWATFDYSKDILYMANLGSSGFLVYEYKVSAP